MTDQTELAPVADQSRLDRGKEHGLKFIKTKTAKVAAALITLYVINDQLIVKPRDEKFARLERETKAAEIERDQKAAQAAQEAKNKALRETNTRLNAILPPSAKSWYVVDDADAKKLVIPCDTRAINPDETGADGWKGNRFIYKEVGATPVVEFKYYKAAIKDGDGQVGKGPETAAVYNLTEGDKVADLQKRVAEQFVDYCKTVEPVPAVNGPGVNPDAAQSIPQAAQAAPTPTTGK